MSGFDKLVGILEDEEGFVDHVYLDPVGVETVGFGDTRKESIRKYRKNGITLEQARADLADLARGFWDGVDRLCTAPLNENQHVAYTSLAYNIGLGGFEGSTTLARHNAGDKAGAAEAILWWDKGTVNGQLVVLEGLRKRRRREHDLYLAGDAPAPAPIVIHDNLGTIGLVSLNSALCLDIDAQSTENGASIVQWPDNQGQNQEFAIVPIPDGNADEVAIVTHAGKVLDVAEYSTEPGARIHQWEYHGGTNQRWRIHSTGNVWEIQSVHSGLFLDVRGNSVDPGADLIQWERTSSHNQLFLRVRQQRTMAVNPVVGPQPAPEPDKQPEPDPNFDVGAALAQIGGFPLSGPGSPSEEDVYGFQAGFTFWDLSIDGDAGPETVKALRYVLDNGGRCGKYFTFSEFGCKHCGRCRISRVHVRALDAYRERVGPVSIISGTRCEEHNRNVGGATNSQHRPFPGNRGMSMATDIPGAMTVGQLADTGLFSGLGYVPSEGNVVVHTDSRGDGPNNTTGGTRSNPTRWTY